MQRLIPTISHKVTALHSWLLLLIQKLYQPEKHVSFATITERWFTYLPVWTWIRRRRCRLGICSSCRSWTRSATCKDTPWASDDASTWITMHRDVPCWLRSKKTVRGGMGDVGKEKWLEMVWISCFGLKTRRLRSWEVFEFEHFEILRFVFQHG